ncbi:MAG: hypothetical protein Kow00129_01200 [Thermoleophilia bacterium]
MSEKSLLDKLGVKAELQVDVLDLDEGFLTEGLWQRGADVEHRPRRGSDLIFLGARDREALAALKVLEKVMSRDGAIWVVYPKGGGAITQNDVREAAAEAGLVDVKVVGFSQTETALKLVIPLEKRNLSRES